MAAVGSGDTDLRLPNFATAARIPRRLPVGLLICSVSTPTPRKLTNRKNYLRQKLLKTLTKPYPNSPTIEFPQTNPTAPVELEQEQVLIEQFSGDYGPAAIGEELEELEMQEFRKAEVQESVKLMDDLIGKVSKSSIFKYGLWLVAAFVFHSICAVWVFGSAGFDDKSENMLSKDNKNSIFEVDVNGKGKSRVKLLRNIKLGLENGGFVYVDEDEMHKRIEEIQVMAREARARERLEREVSGFDSGDSEGEDEFGRSGIGKEINDGLDKVRRRYEYAHGTLPGGSIESVKENGVIEKNNLGGLESIDDVSKKKSLGGKEGEDSLLFKKKYKFRGLSGNPSNKPKGFTGLALMNSDLGREKQVLRVSKFQGTAEQKFIKEKNNRGQEENMSILESKSDGPAEQRNQGKPATDVVISRRSNILEKTELSNGHAMSNENSNLKSRGTENFQSASRIGQKNSERETDFCWLRLPYVLVILMQKRFDADDVEQGLFTLRSSSYSQNDASHTVAFEDRGDATNFCYLVQSFFEDLEDFTAEVIPLPIKELEERVKSQTFKVIVVKKGQLKLYAGQPLADVEMALRSLVGQS